MTEQSAPPGVSRYQVTVSERVLVVELREEADGALVARIDGGEERRIRRSGEPGDALVTLLAGSASISALVGATAEGWTVVLDGEPIDVMARDERAARLAGATAAGRKGTVDGSLKAPMPGLVAAVLIEPGQAVGKGAALVVLQAMKMQNELTARDDAVVKEVHVQVGQTVDQGQVLVTFG